MINKKIARMIPLLNLPENDCAVKESSRVTYTTSKIMIADIPPTHARITGWNKLIFCLNDTMNIAAIVAAKVAIMQGIKISVGFCAPKLDLYAITVTGINVSPDACRARNMICELDAMLLFGF